MRHPLTNATFSDTGRLLTLLIAMVTAATLGGCGGGGGTGPSASPSGFYIESVFWSGLMMVDESGANGEACHTTSNFVPVPSNCPASQFQHWGPTMNDGRYFLATNVFPENWSFVQDPSAHCKVPASKDAVEVKMNGQIVQIMCQSFPSASIAPSTVAAGSPPSNLTIWGSGISNAYGPPQVMIYNEFGNVVATASATTVMSHNSVYITSIFAVVCCPCRDLHVHSILVRNSGAHCASSSTVLPWLNEITA